MTLYNIAGKLIDKGKNTPADLAATIVAQFPQSIRGAQIARNPKLEGKLDSVAISHFLDSWNKAPEVEAEGENNETETGVREGITGAN